MFESRRARFFAREWNAMFLALLFLASSLYSGFLAAGKLEILDSQLKKLAFGFLASFAVQSAFILALSWVSGGLREEWIFLSSVLFAAVAFKLFGARNSKAHASHMPATKSDAVAVAFAFLFLALNLLAVLHLTPSGVESVISVWGDYPLHLGIANSFVMRDNFPPQYPALVGEPLKYSFLMDFGSAILMKGGFDARSAFVIPNALVFLALALGIVLLAGFFAQGKRARLVVFLALLLFFFNGNYGLGQAVEDALSQNSLSPLLQPTRNYSNVDAKNVLLMNWVYSVLLPARSALLGLALSVFVYAFLFSSVLNGAWRKSELFAAGVLTGLMPLAHAHSLIAIAFVAGFLFLVSKMRREWIFFIAPALLIGLPQVAWLSSKLLLKPYPGWMAAEKTLLGVVEFWLKNGWAVLLGFIAWVFFAWKKNERKLLLFAIPFAALFVFANLVVVQPWEWDNTKLFIHFFLFASIASALFLDSLLQRKHVVNKAIACAIVLLAIGSGVLAVEWTAWGDNARYETFSNEDFAMAQWIERNTPENALFLSSGFHQNPVPALAGRQIIAGYEGWLWSHGLDYRQKVADEKLMFEKGDCALIEAYGVDFVLVRTPWEKTLPFENPADFKKVYEDRRGNMLFQSKCSA